MLEIQILLSSEITPHARACLEIINPRVRVVECQRQRYNGAQIEAYMNLHLPLKDVA